MYNMNEEKILQEEMNNNKNRIIIERFNKKYNELVTSFKDTLRSGKNASTEFNAIVKSINDIPDELQSTLIKRYIDTAGLAATSKSPYLYSYIPRCLNTAVTRIKQNDKVDKSIYNIILNSIESFQKRSQNTNDAEIKRGLTTLTNALRTTATQVKGLHNEGYIYDDEVISSIDFVLQESMKNNIDIEDILLGENLRSMARRVSSNGSRINKQVDHVIDNTVDTVRYEREKRKLMQVRQEVLTGRAPASKYVRTAVALIAVSTGILPPIAVAPIIVSYGRHKKLRERERVNLINELVSEMEIINEKIKDAEADNDRQKKYAYIRLRREIQRGVDQLKFGDRFNISRNPIKL